jgi:hypothetical protein
MSATAFFSKVEKQETIVSAKKITWRNKICFWIYWEICLLRENCFQSWRNSETFKKTWRFSNVS